MLNNAIKMLTGNRNRSHQKLYHLYRAASAMFVDIMRAKQQLPVLFMDGKVPFSNSVSGAWKVHFPTFD